MLGRLEEAVFPAFQLVLTEDVQEFHPYVFQIFAQLIELRPPPVAPVYLQLLPGLLSPTFWERAGNVPALVRLVQVRCADSSCGGSHAYISMPTCVPAYMRTCVHAHAAQAYLSKGAAEVVAAGQLQPLLGVFQKLLASKVHDHEGFRVLHAIVVYVAPDALQPFLPTVWQLLLQRLQTARTPKYQRLFVGFVALVIAKQGVPAARDALNSMQPGLFLMLLTNVRVLVWYPAFARERLCTHLCEKGLARHTSVPLCCASISTSSTSTSRHTAGHRAHAAHHPRRARGKGGGGGRHTCAVRGRRGHGAGPAPALGEPAGSGGAGSGGTPGTI